MIRSDLYAQKLMLFDLSINGHHPIYIKHLIQWWGKHQLPVDLDIVVSPRFIKHHSDVIDLATKYNHFSIQFIPILEQEENEFKLHNLGPLQRMQRAFQEWQLLCRYAGKLKSDHCLILYFDPYQLPLIMAERSPCPISGIYFRPTFHYQNFTQCRLTRRDRIQQIREKILLRQVFRNPQLKTLFSLDPFAVEYLKKIQKKVQISSLPDPIVETFVSPMQVLQLRERLGVQENRKIALLFGALNGRKGIYELLDALIDLPSQVHSSLCLVLAGQVNLKDYERLTAKIAEIHSSCTVQIISQFEFLAESEVPIYFKMADIILAPYQHHVGMSGILLQAASAGKPVLSSNFGLMGEMVEKYRLGLAIDSSKTSEIAVGLCKLLTDESLQLFDIETMNLFAKENSADKFSSIIFDGIL
jgi:glycosyltransferase involved in cell wall biosynthesis